MRRIDLHGTLGVLCFITLLALGAPTIAVAGDDDAALQCSDASQQTVSHAREAMARLQQRLNAEARSADPNAPRLVVLNTRGYGYDAPLAPASLRPAAAAPQAAAGPAAPTPPPPAAVR